MEEIISNKKLIAAHLDGELLIQFERIKDALSRGGIISVSHRDVIAYLLDFHENGGFKI
jgi:hypothetical protein